MPVNKRTYASYSGTVTPAWSRFAILTRYGLADAWSSRITNLLFVLCLSPTVIAFFLLYIMSSSTARFVLATWGGPSLPSIEVEARFFFGILSLQCLIALALAAWTGPRLMAADLSNNALPIILSRPITRAEYMIGKMTVLWTLLSAATWAPLLLVFVFQSRVSAKPWAADHMFIASGIFFGGIIWVLLLSLLAVAVASWVRWRIVATGFIFGTMFIAAGIGSVFNEVMTTKWGHVINVPYMMTETWMRLLHVPRPAGLGNELPNTAIGLAFLGIAAVCVTALNLRIRGREVVRG